MPAGSRAADGSNWASGSDSGDASGSDSGSESRRTALRRGAIAVTGSAHGARGADLQLDESGLSHPLQVGADGVGVEMQPVGQLGRGERRRRLQQLGEELVPGLVPERLVDVERLQIHRPDINGEDR